MFEIFTASGRCLGACHRADVAFWLESGHIARDATRTYWLDNGQLQVSDLALISC